MVEKKVVGVCTEGNSRRLQIVCQCCDHQQVYIHDYRGVCAVFRQKRRAHRTQVRNYPSRHGTDHSPTVEGACEQTPQTVCSARAGGPGRARAVRDHRRAAVEPA